MLPLSRGGPGTGRATLVLLALAVAAACGARYVPTECGVSFDVAQGARTLHVEVATATSSAFRLSLSYAKIPTQMRNRMLATDNKCAPSQIKTEGSVVRLEADFGFVAVDTVNSSWSFGSTDGQLSSSATLAEPTSAGLDVVLGVSPKARFYGGGGGLETVHSLLMTSSQPGVKNREFFTSHVWSSDGFGALGIAADDSLPTTITEYGASWAAETRASTLTYTFTGVQADLYLWPSKTMASGSVAYYNLTGRPPVPPRYAFGFLASRWGWRNRKYIESVLTQFRNGSFPLDAFICDFEWYTPEPDYSLPNSGSPTFKDFDYNSELFSQPVAQLATYHNNFHVRFGGIRKPRLGNSDLLDMARGRGWLIGNSRNLNYSRADVKSWYGAQIERFLGDGVDFWWNDEGETQYFTFFDWNAAQLNVSKSARPGKRFFTINRSFSPGMQRLGTVVWTGDTPVSWAALKHTAGYLLNWGLAGAGYITCDIGGFDGLDDPPDLLVRWYQLGVFLPVMRVHSYRYDKAHFPFEYRESAAAAMRNALNLRYALIPYFYSLAHRFAATGDLLMKPLTMVYPEDRTVEDTTTEWLVGDVLAVPVLDVANVRQVYLPKGVWYSFNTSTTHTGPARLNVIVPLETQLAFVRQGSIITLAPPLQYSDQLPGGPLRVQIYPGADATFTLFEDDGETYAYQQGQLRAIVFTWTNANRTLSWSAPRGPIDAHGFTEIVAHAMFAPSSATSSVRALTASGAIVFP